jgi:hypothetical protein
VANEDRHTKTDGVTWSGALSCRRSQPSGLDGKYPPVQDGMLPVLPIVSFGPAGVLAVASMPPAAKPGQMLGVRAGEDQVQSKPPQGLAGETASAHT